MTWTVSAVLWLIFALGAPLVLAWTLLALDRRARARRAPRGKSHA